MPDESPEVQAQIDRLFEAVFQTLEANEKKFDDALLRLIGKLCVRFNRLERDLKYLLTVLRDDLPLREAYKSALKVQSFYALLKQIQETFSAKFSGASFDSGFQEIMKEAEYLRVQRNLMLHSVWLATTDPEKPFVRVKEDEQEPEIDFDIKTVEELVDRMGECCNRAYAFLVDNVPGYGELPSKLFDLGPFGPTQ
jgi:hypothetical protein